MADDLFRVFWQVKGQDKVCWGEPINYDTAKSWKESMNKEYPYIKHWVATANHAEVYARANAKTEEANA